MEEETKNIINYKLSQLFDWIESSSISEECKRSMMAVILIDFFGSWQIDSVYVVSDKDNNELIKLLRDPSSKFRITFGISYIRQLDRYLKNLFFKLNKLKNKELYGFPILEDFFYDNTSHIINYSINIEDVLITHKLSHLSLNTRPGLLKDSLSDMIIIDKYYLPDNFEFRYSDSSNFDNRSANLYLEKLSLYFENWMNNYVTLEEWLNYPNIDVFNSIYFQNLSQEGQLNNLIHQSVLYEEFTNDLFINEFKHPFDSNRYKNEIAIKDLELTNALVENNISEDINHKIEKRFCKLDYIDYIVENMETLLCNNYQKFFYHDIHSQFCLANAEAILKYNSYLKEYLCLEDDMAISMNNQRVPKSDSILIAESVQLILDNLENMEYLLDEKSYLKKHAKDEEDFEYSFFIYDLKYDRLYEDRSDIFILLKPKLDDFKLSVLRNLLLAGDFNQLKGISSLLSVVYKKLVINRVKYIEKRNKPNISIYEKRRFNNMLIPIVEIKQEITLEFIELIKDYLQPDIILSPESKPIISDLIMSTISGQNEYSDNEISEYINDWVKCRVSLNQWLSYKSFDLDQYLEQWDLTEEVLESINKHKHQLCNEMSDNIFNSFKLKFDSIQSNDIKLTIADKECRLIDDLMNGDVDEIKEKRINLILEVSDWKKTTLQFDHIIRGKYESDENNNIHSKECYAKAEAVLKYKKMLVGYIDSQKDKTYSHNNNLILDSKHLTNLTTSITNTFETLFKSEIQAYILQILEDLSITQNGVYALTDRKKSSLRGVVESLIDNTVVPDITLTNLINVIAVKINLEIKSKLDYSNTSKSYQVKTNQYLKANPLKVK